MWDREPKTGETGMSEAQGDFLGAQPRSFARPGPKDGRIGVIDVGSNSVRMVVFEGGLRTPAQIFNEKVLCGLGARLADTGLLDPTGKRRALAAMRRFAALAEALEVDSLAGIATAAIRDAADGADFAAQIHAETGVKLVVASGADEARLAAQGVLYGNPDASGVVVDLGGASMELIRIGGGVPGTGVTTPLGPLRLASLAAHGADIGAEIARHLAALPPACQLSGGRLHLVGGAWRSLFRVELDRSGYPLKVLHEYTLPGPAALGLADWAAGWDDRMVAAMAAQVEGRAAALPMAGRLLAALIRALGPGDVAISAFGLREGVCFEALPPILRARDPLIAACEDQEFRRARAPGFGAELGAWTLSVIPPRDAAEARLIRATALLADVCWRTHPDYRVPGCWETVTRVNLTGAGHQARVMMGVALATRYKRGRKTLEGIEAVGLLDAAGIERATQIGLALRVGCELSAGACGILPDVGVEYGTDGLTLILTGRAHELQGEEVDKRLTHLAQALGVEARLRLG